MDNVTLFIMENVKIRPNFGGDRCREERKSKDVIS